MQFGFVGGTYESRTLNANAQRAVNLYPAIDESGSGKAKAILAPTPGLSVFKSGLAGAMRGLWAGEGRLFVVAGSTLYEISSDGTPTNLGDVGNDGKPVQMFPNGNQLAIISNGLFWLHTGTELVQPDFTGGSDHVTAVEGSFLDGFFLVIDAPDEEDAASVRRFRHSALQDGLTWDPLDYASKEGYPDMLAAMLADHEDLWLFGSQTTEVWRNNYSTAPESFPWERDPGAFIHYGNIAPWATVRMPEGVGWLAGDPRGHAMAFHAVGYRPQRVSTHAVEQAWAKYSTVGDAEGYTYTEDGHYFWVISFPTADATWVYDVSSKLWHERAWLTGSTLHRHRSRGHAYVFGRHLVGDWETGTIYEMGVHLGSDAGADIRRIRTAPYFSDAEEQVRIFHHRLQLDVQADENLDISLDWSNDSARNWSTARTVTTGPGDADGEQRAMWRRLGEARHRVYRATITSDLAGIALINAQVRVTGGKS